ncbi:metallophosphoesterase family protein [Sinomicrobium weinanense]|uniref:Metallophosphoesterase n=1 Tax=Sinomicrobium weinanense TaxID=2842200 RepID=A0A926Q393_9FLAO|nr:metallophosphoesterase [Sinomicrobium weinanense]MBC9797333.1 metallophosphoesterase [Sinomicrobium weinanense]MBU3124513.1 metallophosphoesterase [Sinomicrobium weinanense]
MKRRNFIKIAGTGSAGLSATFATPLLAQNKTTKRSPVLKIAHITDVHIRPEENAPRRFKQCLRELRKLGVDFFLNGGDSIYAADYDHITRERVTEQWNIWDDCIREIDGHKIYSCIGNHDIWWAAPDKQDSMYGKEYVVQRLHIPGRYYSFSEKGWHFIVLDGNNPSVSLDEEQFQWLKNELEQLPENTPVLLMSHYPILGVTPFWEGGMHSDYQALKTLFYKHRDKVKLCLSGHQHLLDSASYNGVSYFCNGAMSGFWWEKGDKSSAAKGYCQETPPGYAILELYNDGSFTNTYIPHTY